MEQGSPQDALISAFSAGPLCPREDELAATYMGGEPVPVEIAQHVEGCAHCQAEVAMIGSFSATPRNAEEAAAVRQITARLRASSPVEKIRWWQGLFSMPIMRPAAVVFAGLLLVVVAQVDWQNRPGLNGVTGEEVQRSAAISIAAPLGDVSEPPSEARWDAVKGASGYQVRLLEVDRKEIWSVKVATAEAAFPADVRARFLPAKTLLLQVVAYDSTGRTLSESSAVPVRFLQTVHK